MFLGSFGFGSLCMASPQSLSTTADQRAGSTGAKDPILDIFQAAYSGDTARAGELAKINPAIARLRSPDGRTPLHYAVAGGRLEMISFLTVQGADLSAGPESPLLTAVEFPDHSVAFAMSQALLMNASDPNAKRADGRTAVDLATARRYQDVVEILVHRGATAQGAETVQVERVYFGQRYSFDIKGRKYTSENIEGLPQEFINEFVRVAHGDEERVKHLLGIAPGLLGSRATWDELAVEAASHMGLVALARFLAEQGSPVSACTATLIGLQDRVAALIKSDANCVRERGAHDIGLIAYAAYGEQRAEIADLLLRSGASVQAKALGGVSTLHLAANKGYLELAEVLLNHGADVNVPAISRGQEVTPVGIAMRANRDKMVEYLKSRGGHS